MTGENDELYLQVGKRVREAREAAKMTQEDLAKIIGLTRASVTNIETARQKVQLQTLYAIADALQISVPNLLPPAQVLHRNTSTRAQQAIENSKSLRPGDREVLTKMLSQVSPHRSVARKVGRNSGGASLK